MDLFFKSSLILRYIMIGLSPGTSLKIKGYWILYKLKYYFALSSVFVFISYILLGNVNTFVLQYSTIALIGVLPGMFAGFSLFKMFSLQIIRKIVYGFMMMFGLYLFIVG